MPIHLLKNKEVSELHEHIGVLLHSVSSPGGRELPKFIKPCLILLIHFMTYPQIALESILEYYGLKYFMEGTSSYLECSHIPLL